MGLVTSPRSLVKLLLHTFFKHKTAIVELYLDYK